MSRGAVLTCARVPALGYPMAKNLRAKIPASDTLVIHDRNTEATTKFMQEVGMAAGSTGAEGSMGIEIVGSPRAVAEKSVSEF